MKTAAQIISPPESPSIFEEALKVLASLKEGQKLNPVPACDVSQLKRTGSHYPCLIPTNLRFNDQKQAHRVSSAIAKLLMQACRDAGREDIHIRGYVISDEDSGEHQAHLTIGSHTPDREVGEFPNHAVAMKVSALRQEIFGAADKMFVRSWQPSRNGHEGDYKWEQGDFARHWQPGHLSLGGSPVKMYKWEAKTEREKKVQLLAVDILAAQGVCPIYNPNGTPHKTFTHPLLLVTEKDMERLARRELSPAQSLSSSLLVMRS